MLDETKVFRSKVAGRVVPAKLSPRGKSSGQLTGTNGLLADMAGTEEPVYVPHARSAKRPNRINLKAVAEVLAENGMDPTVELVKIVQSGKLEPDVQARVLGTLMEYVHSKKKSVEITGADGGAIQVENVSDDVLMRIAMQAIPADVIDV